VPPPTFEGVAVKVTLVPRQIVPLAFDAKFTEGVADEITDINTSVEVAEVIAKHVPSLIVIAQDTTSSLAIDGPNKTLEVPFGKLKCPILKV
jgi:hypothetical protein